MEPLRCRSSLMCLKDMILLPIPCGEGDRPICQSHLQTPISILIQSLKALTNRDIDTYSKQCKPFTNQHFKQPPPDLSLLCASSPHSPSRRDCTLPQLQQFIVIGTPCSSSHHVLLSLYDCRR